MLSITAIKRKQTRYARSLTIKTIREPPKDGTRRIAVIIGAGPSLGAAIACFHSSACPDGADVTLSYQESPRTEPFAVPAISFSICFTASTGAPNFDSFGKLLAVSCDSLPTSLDETFTKTREKWAEGVVEVGVYTCKGLSILAVFGKK